MPGRSAIGLDIGTSAVRAARVSTSRGAVVLERFGEVPLPQGAVRDGEIVDQATVVQALKHLWRHHRLGARKVVLGVANQKVVVRQVELPWLPPAEIRQSLPFHVQDFIPMAVEAAVLDFVALSEHTTDGGDRRMDGLLVAAARDMVLSSVDTAEAAGLRPVAVDLSSFALIRAMAWPAVPAPYVSYVPAGQGAAAPQGGDAAPLPSAPAQPAEPASEGPPVEAIVDVGARVTNVVVHQGGVPRFVRILLLGGQNLVAAVSERTGADHAQAEEVVRSLGLARPSLAVVAQAEPAARAIDVAGAELIDEVRGSLDYHVSSSGSLPVSRILLSGGGARIPGLAERLSDVTRTEVHHGHPLAGLDVRQARMSPEQLAYVEPVTAVAVGLARGAAV